VSAPPVSISFFDTDRELYGTARSGATLLFEGKSASAVPAGPQVESKGEGLRAVLDDSFELELEPVTPEADLGGVTARVCRVRGTIGDQRVDCLGTASETHNAPAWEELDAVRSITALVDERHSLLALARRPRGALGHGEELVVAWLVQEGELLSVEDARISTVYDGEGRQRSAGLELWLPGEDFPRRGSGIALAGTSLELEGLRVQAAVFRWRLEGREAIGSYELMVRSEEPAAA
jgi:hypothetical protein